MSHLVTPLLAYRPELVVKPLGDRGEHVVKDNRTWPVTTGGEEDFLLDRALRYVRTEFWW